MIILHGMASAVRDKHVIQEEQHRKLYFLDLLCLYCFNSLCPVSQAINIPLHRLPLCLPRRDQIPYLRLPHFFSIPLHIANTHLVRPTRSVTALFRSNSSLASCLISRLVFSSAMRLVLRRTCRQSDSTLPLWRNYVT